MNGTLFGEHKPSAVYRLRFKWLSWKSISRILLASLTNSVSLIAIAQQRRVLYFWNLALSSLYLGFQAMDFPEAPYVDFNTQPLIIAQDCLDSINNEGHFTWRAEFLLGCISGCIREIFLKFHIYNSRHSRLYLRLLLRYFSERPYLEINTIPY